MAAPLLLVFALIQAPNAAPQDVQLATLTVEPVLARGIAVQVVEDAGVEAAGTEPVALTAAPITRATFVGVVPKRGLDCVTQNRPCPWLYVRGGDWGWNPLGWDRESLEAWRVVLAEQREAENRMIGYRQFRATAEARAAEAAKASNAARSFPRSTSSPSGTNAGGAQSSGSVWTGTSSGGATAGSPLSRGRLE
jgi:hypothetical protein